ncbi:MAG: enoyl-CoA hydratase/isomerase family protein [Proteobacteria bacterium]|nr:enoyl-CoA hydratase/isomerase family protein [Pseudomonadota bacterium]
MSEQSTVRVTAADGIAEIVLNRPDQRNALNMQMCLELHAAATRVADDKAVRVVLLRAAGPVFSAGADLKERKGMTEDQVRTRRLRGFAAYDAIERLPKPCIAVVHGAAFGSGCEIATACDFAIAGERASFCYPEVMRGTVGATQRLPRIVGTRMAKDLMFTGRVVGAAEALRLGLVTRVVADADLDRVARDIAAQIAKAPALSLRLAKRCIDQTPETDRAGALANELMAIEESLAGDEWRAGAAGFAKDKS